MTDNTKYGVRQLSRDFFNSCSNSKLPSQALLCDYSEVKQGHLTYSVPGKFLTNSHALSLDLDFISLVHHIQMVIAQTCQSS